MTLPSCSPHTALVVEDDPSIRRLLKRSLGPSFTVDTANDSHFAKECLFHKRFDLTLLDIGLPDGSGLQLCQMIKADVYMRHMPVIFVSGMGAISDRIDGINIGADDYITKPFSPAELLARSEAAVRKSIINLEANPLTLLPGNGTIEREIYRQIQSGRVFSVLYIDINNFKAYNDYYGFLRGDGVIRRSGELLVESIHGSSDTVGHIGGDDFIIISNTPDIEALCQRIIKNFDQAVPGFYEKDDLLRGSIVTKNRKGQQESFPLISLAIGVATNKSRPLCSVGEVATTGSELKCFAKKFPGSYFAIEKRKEAYPAPLQSK